MDHMHNTLSSAPASSVAPATSSNLTGPSSSNMAGGMYFFNGTPFTLLFPGWVITSGGQLAGAWFACFFLALVFELLQVFNAKLEARFKLQLAIAAKRICACGGLSCRCSGPQHGTKFQWWQSFSGVDHARALLRFVTWGIAYLLMLAVMSFNVAIFFAVLCGVYVGSLLSGLALGSQVPSATPMESIQVDTAAPKVPLANRWPACVALLVRAASVTLLVLTCVWVVQVEGSLGFQQSSLFGWHALLMTIAFPICMSEAIMAFTAPLLPLNLLPQALRPSAPLALHLTMHVVPVVCAPLALAAIGFYKHLSPKPIEFPFFTMFSVHSWMGVATLATWLLQLLSSVACRLSIVPAEWLGSLKRVHPFVGKASFVLGLATCALGFGDMQSSDLAGQGYRPLSTFSLMAPAACIALIALGLGVFAVLELQQARNVGGAEKGTKAEEAAIIQGGQGGGCCSQA